MTAMDSKPIVNESEIVTGERLQAIADVAVITEEKLRFHASCPSMPLARLAPDLTPDAAALTVLKDARVIFVYSEMIDAFLIHILPQLERPVVVVTHNGDHHIGELYRTALDDPKIIHWFAQNAIIDHRKLTALPIGVANAQWPYGDTAALARIANRPIAKRSGLYVNFAVSTNPAVRGPLMETLRQKPFAVMNGRAPAYRLRGAVAKLIGRPFNGPLPYGAYLADMAQWRFCVSPPGNGIDCHRSWEALYLGVVPVMQRAVDGLLDGLPCIIVNDLGAVTLEGLEAAFAALRGPFAWEKLTLSYWHRRIRQAADKEIVTGSLSL